MSFNHLLRYDDEASALVALPAFQSDGFWRDDIVIPGQRVVLARAEWDTSDPENPVEVAPEVALPGYYLTVSLPEISTPLRDLPGNACRLIGDSETGEIVYTAPDLDVGLLETAIIEPAPAGAVYVLGG